VGVSIYMRCESRARSWEAQLFLLLITPRILNARELVAGVAGGRGSRQVACESRARRWQAQLFLLLAPVVGQAEGQTHQPLPPHPQVSPLSLSLSFTHTLPNYMYAHMYMYTHMYM
jgi:hypothetical protein